MMKKLLSIMLCAVALTGCTTAQGQQPKQPETTAQVEPADETVTIETTDPPEIIIETEQPAAIVEAPEMESYFQGIRGCAVFYGPENNTYTVYNPELWEYESSPCSTFKIISSFMGFENGLVDIDNSTRSWDGEAYWNKEWNRDIDIREAFRVSCIWYFRDLIDDLGSETVQSELNRLQYGNCDISDWAGTLNTNNNNLRLRGFWVESSLKVSPRQQVEVLNRIFGEDSIASAETRDNLKSIMLTDLGTDELKIYGKTGWGVKDGRNLDAWFVGMYEENSHTTYFAIRLDDPDNKDAISTKAREIAIDLIIKFNK